GPAGRCPTVKERRPTRLPLVPCNAMGHAKQVSYRPGEGLCKKPVIKCAVFLEAWQALLRASPECHAGTDYLPKWPETPKSGRISQMESSIIQLKHDCLASRSLRY